jgi:hypothetical protein
MTDSVGAFKGSMIGQREKLGDRTRGVSFLRSGRGWPIRWTFSMATEPDGMYLSYYEADVLLAESAHRSQRRTNDIHSDLSKRIRRYHLHRLVFKCHGSDIVFEILKGCKYHQKNANAAALPDTPSPAIPGRQVRALPVIRSRMPRSCSTSAMTAASGQISTPTLSVPPATDTSEPSTTTYTSTSIHRRVNKNTFPTAAGAPPPASPKVRKDPIHD